MNRRRLQIPDIQKRKISFLNILWILINLLIEIRLFNDVFFHTCLREHVNKSETQF